MGHPRKHPQRNAGYQHKHVCLEPPTMPAEPVSHTPHHVNVALLLAGYTKEATTPEGEDTRGFVRARRPSVR